MSHFKIIETEVLLPDVLLHRDRYEDGTEFVEIKAIGIIDGDNEMFAVEKVTFECPRSAIAFIRDFSTTTANEWCKKNSITY